MIKLNSEDYYKVKELITSTNELSIFSVLEGIMPGEVYVDRLNEPTATFIKTSECNLIAGNPSNADFNRSISSELDFWDQITPDSTDWYKEIPKIHLNKFVREYKRRHYILAAEDFLKRKSELPAGFYLKKAEPNELKSMNLENTEDVLEWIDGWGSEETFIKHGTGFVIHNGSTIVSWSIADCSIGDKIAIGIHTDKKFQGQGFGIQVASKTVEDCLENGYKSVEWLCVDSNKGSIAIAEKLGFNYNNEYISYTSYPPIENMLDLTESEWQEWAEYLDNASKEEDRLTEDSLYCYINANNVTKAIKLMLAIEQQEESFNYIAFNNYIKRLQELGMCSDFKKKEWVEFIDTKIIV